jgi:rubrerythrin
MAREQETTTGALKTAIQMEIDGKEYYLKSSRASTNELGKKLFKKLAVEEDIHKKVFEGIYKNISAKKGWPESKTGFDGGRGLRTVFAAAVQAMAKNTRAIPTELKAIETAMDMENKTYDFYKKRSGLATFAGEKEFYEEIAAQEKEHHRALLDYFEFLKNPAAWFVQKEHQSLDGG